MPGVMLDDHNLELGTTPVSPWYESLGSCPSTSYSPLQRLSRHNSFTSVKDNSSLSQSAPIYQRSRSATYCPAVQPFNYCSPPMTPQKSGELENTLNTGFSMLDSYDDYLSMRDNEVTLGNVCEEPASALSMVISGNSGSGDVRNLTSVNSAIVGSPTLPDSVSALHKYLPSNNEDDETCGRSVADVYACDQFRMFEFKVRRCMRGRSHDWTECPFAHPGEKARRRDPRRFHYSGTACPDFRKGSCRRGDACEFAHGVFECWLHPARYRTQPCKDGRNCPRRVCFFAHTPEQFRLLPAVAQAANAAARTGGLSIGQSPPLTGVGSSCGSYDGSPGRGGFVFDGPCTLDLSAGCVALWSGFYPRSFQSSCMHGGACVKAEQSYGGKGNTNGIHCCPASQLSSPTSTLVGHSTSPPPLSPPLSPTWSPPMSPQSPHNPLSSGVHQNLASLSLSPQSFVSKSAFNQPSLQDSVPQGACPQGPLSRSSSIQSAVSAALATTACYAHTTPSVTVPAHRRHLDRLNSLPTLSIPHVDYSRRGIMHAVCSPLSSPSSGSPPPSSVNSGTTLSDFIATTQQLGLRGSEVPLWVQSQSQAASSQYSSRPSPLRRCSQSVPSTPTKLRYEDRLRKWEVDGIEYESPVERVESGRDLRAKIYGRLRKDSRLDTRDVPDLGWVSELVKDEQVS